MNFFAYPSAAKRYANGRPFFHPLAIKKIKEVCCENGRIDCALDVGCGTGQSTQALLEVAEQFVGYLVTQTNVISAVETGKENLQSVANWLLDSARAIFSGEKEKFSFFCQIQFFKRS